MRLKLALSYLCLLLPSFLFFAVLWSAWAPDRLYHRLSDSPLAVLPPFVRDDFRSNGEDHEYYIVPQRTVYLIWFGFVGAAFLIPAAPPVLLWHVYRLNDRSGLLRDMV
jgi:hypothetical protein